MTHYGVRLGCRFGQTHDMFTLGENKRIKVERCKICGQTYRWPKGYKGRIDNKEYLKVHLRQFAQDFGATKRAYMRLYKPQNTVIHI